MKNKTNAVQVIARATKCPDFEPDEIFSLMRRLNMNEKGLAILMNVTPATVRLWTSGAVKPCGTAKRIIGCIWITMLRFLRQMPNTTSRQHHIGMIFQARLTIADRPVHMPLCIAL